MCCLTIGISLPLVYGQKAIKLTTKYINQIENIFGEVIEYNPKYHRLNKSTGKFYHNGAYMGTLDLRTPTSHVVRSKPRKDVRKLDVKEEFPPDQSKPEDVTLHSLVERLDNIMTLLRENNGNSGKLEQDVRNLDEFSQLDWKALIKDPEELSMEYNRRLALCGESDDKLKRVEEWYNSSLEASKSFEAKVMGLSEIPAQEKSSPMERLL